MKKIVLVRHAKSCWKDESLSDFLRPLSKRGRKNAPFMAGVLRQKGVLPDIIVSSPACRAKETVELLASHLGFVNPIAFEERLYEATGEEIERVIKSIDEKYESAFVVGHNPGMNEFASRFVAFEQNIVTCGIVEIAFACERFCDISPENAVFVAFEYPKKSYDLS